MLTADGSLYPGAVGLWDEAADSYLVPGDSADADSPGGAGGLEGRPTVIRAGCERRLRFG